jgi:hypothetical protein
MRIEPAALAKAIGALDAMDLDRGLVPSVLQLATMTKRPLDVDGVGLMLVDAQGRCAGRPPPTSRPSRWNRPRETSRRAPAPMRSGSGRRYRSAMSPARAPSRSRWCCLTAASGPR